MKTPKEKAEELSIKFCSPSDVFKPNISSKRFALTAADEILWEITKYADNSKEYVVENSNYWQEVKIEINKL